MNKLILSAAFILIGSNAFAASSATVEFIKSQPAIEASTIVAANDGESNRKRCGNDWKAKKADLTKTGWTWPRYQSACITAIKGK